MKQKNSLRIRFKDCKAVASADIKLGGLTVVCGPNATGKSTIAKTTRTMLESLLYYRDCRRSALLWEYVKEVLEPLRMTLMFSGAVDRFHDYAMDFDYRLRREPLSELDVKGFIDDAVETIHAVGRKIHFSRLSKPIGARFFNQVAVDFSSVRTSGQFDAVINDSVEKLKKNVRAIDTEHVTARKFIGLPFDRSSLWCGNVSLVEQEEDVFAYEKQKITSFSPIASVSNVVYLESPLVSQPNFDGGRLRMSGNVISRCAEDEFAIDDPYEFYRVLDRIISGHIVGSKKRSGRVLWEYARRDGERFPYQECATGIKAFAILSQLYGHGCLHDGTVLIIDEPEAHLHPAWVVEYAALLIKIVENIGARVLVASHSPDMVNALQSFALCRNMADRTAFYIAEKCGSGDPFRFKFRPQDVSVEKIFDSFNSAYALIEKKAAELRKR